ncbi:hypothetical protein Q3F40_08655 [Enterococcus faecium]|uniref:hypothetical protein n=1 Tax=Enterococcus faecium TaxID=1352 RepID=UPI0001B6E6DC|nr:hypothetical protein [Enterococcus faecium]EEV50094.1 predicted protein [Enterococcus faecium 1,141,733]MDQ8453035.1 hypothetical protein [Enterococcus faecium]MDQ8470280.1 hypothetical protein [Enterococcus faecium]MDQ8473148.1 hypothetical protein [Enterococcus faecium]NTM07189.1 hypothetical protein [Enterococcus faecium]
MAYCGKIKSEIIEDLYSLEANDFYKTYFKTDEVWYFDNRLSKRKSSEEYKKMISSIISTHFNIPESEYLIVGSAKLGFSLSPYKKFREFGETISGYGQSDLDIAIVSNSLFNELWEAFKELTYKTFVNDYEYISSSVFKGYLNDKYIFKQISLNTDLKAKIDKCNISIQDDMGIIEPINYRFYNSWSDLERYTHNGIIKCKG